MRMAEGCNISMEEYGEAKIGQMNIRITEYLAYCKKVEPLFMIMFTDSIKDAGRNLDKCHNLYANFAQNLTQYEEESLMVYSDYDETQQVINNKDNPTLKDQMINRDLENSYLPIYYWAKGEIADVNALKAAIDVRNASSKKAIDLKKKNTNTQKEIENLESGGKSISTVFKSKSDVGSLTEKISNRETEIEYSIKLADLLTVYQGVTCQEYK